jgi:hypothetical protein
MSLKNSNDTIWDRTSDLLSIIQFYTNSVPFLLRTNFLSITKTSRLKLFREIIGIYCITRYTNTHTHIVWAPFNFYILNKVVQYTLLPLRF